LVLRVTLCSTSNQGTGTCADAALSALTREELSAGSALISTHTHTGDASRSMSVRCLVERMESVLAGGAVAMNCPGTTNLYLPKLGCRASVSLIYSDSISSRILSPFCFADYAPSQVLLFCRSCISPFTLVVGSSTAPSSLPRRPLFSLILSPYDPRRRRGDAWHATVAVFSTSHFLLRRVPSAAAFVHSAPGLVSPHDIPIEASGERGERRAAASDGHHTPRA
jgi:hypothetical protein